ncbi:uncharacterized protein LOC129408950 isoform X2 [Boleophthalmus pectinirostris]|uniref:uncharacterized protein LOC129408950 isoform X2 n=1 Tax=Boleophthalmus pectinirostris TaxID=150288 RepID=UPI00243274C3|nr:uncharacterized protein LOC129408950 isoform X2 [Boleophthalmus pectinirostris]
MVTVVETLLPLILICSHAFADSVSSIMASRGDRVNLTCSTPNIRITQVNWSRGKYHYAFNDNKTSSNFSDTFVIDPKFPPSLSILDFQQNDTGIYKCVVTNKKGLETTIWNVTLTEKDQTKGVSVILLSGIFIYISTMGGLLICSSAVCLYFGEHQTNTRGRVRQMGLCRQPCSRENRADHWMALLINM